MASQPAKSAAKKAGGPAGSRPLHPAVLTSFGPGRGSGSAELAAWAYLTRPRPHPNSDGGAAGGAGGGGGDGANAVGEGDAPLPNLVTALNNALRVYTVLPHAGTLALTAVYDNLAGSICSLDVIPNGTSGGDAAPSPSSPSSTEEVGTNGGTEGGDDGLSEIFADGTPNNNKCSYDGLLLGFAGHPRLSLVYPSAPMVGGSSWSSTSNNNTNSTTQSTGVGTGGVLLASTIIDLTPALIQSSMGGTSFLEQDLLATVAPGAAGDDPTVAVVLGGGVALASFSLPKGPRPDEGGSMSGGGAWWRVASEPYLLPLSGLSAKVRDLGGATATTPANQPGRRGQPVATTVGSGPTLGHGFGDIVDVAFLNGYTEPTAAILHSNPRRGGRAWAGRLGRTAEVPLPTTTHNPSSSSSTKKKEADAMDTNEPPPVETTGTGTNYGLSLTAISLSVRQRRSVVLWTLPDALPADSWCLVPHPTDGVLVVGVNAAVYVGGGGAIRCALAVNGFARVGCPSGLLPPSSSASTKGGSSWSGVHLAPNPRPLPTLALQLDGARVAFVSDTVALVQLGNGTLHSLELHDRRSARGMCMSLVPLGHKVGGLGCASCLAVLPAAIHHAASVRRYLAEDDEGERCGERAKPGRQTRGLAFVGSRMGDCTLVAFSMDGPVRLAGAERANEDEDVKGGKRVKAERARSTAADEPARKQPKREGDSTAVEIQGDNDEENGGAEAAPLTREEILRREEEALYREDDDDVAPSVVSASHADSDDYGEESGDAISDEDDVEGPKAPRRRTVRSLTVLQSLRALDSLTGLGPLGGGCHGPVATCPSRSADDAPPSAGGESEAPPALFSNAFAAAARHYVMPCGYGASGGVAVLTTPGRDNVGSSILCESDLCNTVSVFGLARSNLVLLGKAGGAGCIALRGVVHDEEGERGDYVEGFEELEVSSAAKKDQSSDGMDVDGAIPSFKDAADVLGTMTLLAASEFSSNSTSFSVFFVKAPRVESDGTPYSLVIMTEDTDSKGGVGLNVNFVHRIQDDDAAKSALVSITPMVSKASTDDGSSLSSITFGCVWASGDASVFNISLSQPAEQEEKSSSFPIHFKVSESVIVGDAIDEDVPFYYSNRVVAMDVVSLPAHIFDSPPSTASDAAEELPATTSSLAVNPTPDQSSSLSFPPDRLSMHGTWCAKLDDVHSSSAAPSLSENQVVIAICRLSGQLQIYDNEDAVATPVIKTPSDTVPIWQASGCSHGAAILGQSSPGLTVRRPELHEVEAAEIRFFVAGPSLQRPEGAEANADAERDAWMLRSLCILVDTSQGDLQLYSGSKRASNANRLEFARVPLSTVSRPSEEAGRHLTKLRRKGIVPSSATIREDFRANRLHRFSGISGEDGLFAATPRPLWFVSERGAPTVVSHKSRHVSPAGGRPVPVGGFCTAMPDVFQNARNGFITIHERIGRVGSQRLTLYNGLWDVFAPHGLLPGSGMSIQKVPLGVTVRHIEFIDDASVSSISRPVYAMLVSHEIEADQSGLNDDGLTPEERQRIRDEKEEAKVQKQVEADLGGFDMEQEWVEEIERDNCFTIDTGLGLAPQMPTRKYEVWLVDAGKGWKVLDKHELDEFELGTALKVMYLTDVVEDSDETPERSLFIGVGTSIIDEDGEDLASRGRILLFQVKKSKKKSLGKAMKDPPLELFLKSEKDMALGPVTSLSSLRSEDIYRVVVGAGAEITVEQWGSGKLTQMGFYHAHMQVQDVVLFKTFFLLSDAYDSLHFLVWRESDKSLTLLAKDYEPCNVFAAGLISRGGAMSFVCHDDRQNLSFLQYAPTDAAARGGNKLVCRADFHMGTQTTMLRSHWSQSSLLFNSCTMNSTLAALKQQDTLFGRLEDDQRFSVNFGTVDGSFGSVVPLSEPTYWRLTALQSVMSNALESNCSLSHRAWRLYRRSTRRAGCRSNDRMKGVIDGDLVMKFVDLPLPEQEDLASSIGSTVGLVMDNLLELGCAASVI